MHGAQVRSLVRELDPTHCNEDLVQPNKQTGFFFLTFLAVFSILCLKQLLNLEISNVAFSYTHTTDSGPLSTFLEEGPRVRLALGIVRLKPGLESHLR